MELDAKTAALMNFAGFALAHGVGGVSSGQTLCTMALVQCAKEQGLTQYPGPIGQSVARRKRLQAGSMTYSGERSSLMVSSRWEVSKGVL